MQSAQVHNSQNSGYHGHPPQPPPPAGYAGGIPQQYKQESHSGVNGHTNTPDMYQYQPPHQQQQQQQQQQHAQYQQSLPSYQQQQPQQPGYPGMHTSMLPRMPPPGQPGQPGMLPPLYSGMSAPGMPGMGGQPPMPPSIASQQQMYGAPPQNHGPPIKTERQMSYSAIKGDHKYTLVVEQQPQRARMCGFGDKDRRPITPPPCVRLIITDKNTGEEVDYKALEGSFFILQVDLWDKDAVREVNIVRASSSSPAVSISTATTTSYPPQAERQAYNEHGYPVAPMMYHADGGAYYHTGPYGQPMYAPQYAPPPQQAAPPLYTRNLIGSLTVNASLLEDTDKKPGYWFVLQDLSVRTEGDFRLKMNFIDVGDPSGAPGLNRAKCPVLASVYSESFKVYSAKKFPGVIESTSLSKTFASQGIKIPIRKEGKPDKNEDDEE